MNKMNKSGVGETRMWVIGGTHGRMDGDWCYLLFD